MLWISPKTIQKAQFLPQKTGENSLLCLQELRPATWGLSCALVVEFKWRFKFRRKKNSPQTIRGGNRGSFGCVGFFGWLGWEIFVQFFGFFFQVWIFRCEWTNLEYRETKKPAILQSFCNVYVGVGFRVDFAWNSRARIWESMYAAPARNLKKPDALTDSDHIWPMMTGQRGIACTPQVRFKWYRTPSP